MQGKLVDCLNSLNSSNVIDIATSILAIVDNQETQDVESPDFSSFQGWLVDHAAQIDGLELGRCEYGNGIFAQKEFTSDQLIARIPLKVMISTEFHQRPELNSILDEDQSLKSMDSLVLTIQLLQEDQDKKSFYRPYLDVLPRKLPKLPISYTVTDLEALKGSYIQYEAAMQIILHVKEFLYVTRLIQMHQILHKFSWTSFVWARAIIMTRQNKIPTSNDSTCLALIPFFDMFNHKSGQITTFFNSELKTSDTYSNRVVYKGDQVFICYGNRSIKDLFLFSGFVDVENELDVGKIWIDFSNKIGGVKKELLEKLHIPLKGHFEIRPNVWNTSKKIILYLVVVFAIEKECKDALDKIASSAEWDPLQHFESPNYKRAVDWLSMRCRIIIAALSKKDLDLSMVSILFREELRFYKCILEELES